MFCDSACVKQKYRASIYPMMQMQTSLDQMMQMQTSLGDAEGSPCPEAMPVPLPPPTLRPSAGVNSRSRAVEVLPRRSLSATSVHAPRLITLLTRQEIVGEQTDVRGHHRDVVN